MVELERQRFGKHQGYHDDAWDDVHIVSCEDSDGEFPVQCKVIHYVDNEEEADEPLTMRKWEEVEVWGMRTNGRIGQTDRNIKDVSYTNEQMQMKSGGGGWLVVLTKRTISNVDGVDSSRSKQVVWGRGTDERYTTHT